MRSAAPTLADALANRGLVYLLQDNPGPWAETWLTRALERSQDFAIALNGRGAVRVARGDLDGAERDFNQARAGCPCIALAADNLLSLDLLRIGVQAASLRDVLASTPPGTELYSATSQQQLALSAIGRQVQNAQAQMRAPSDAVLGSLRDNLNRAAVAQTAADLLQPVADALSDARQVGYQLAARLGGVLLQQYADQVRDTARSQLAAVEQSNFNAVLANMTRFPDGQAAQNWAKLGITPQNFTLDVLRNPPPAQGGIAMGGTHIDAGHWPVVIWPGTWYPPAAEAPPGQR
jgi:hypothetical protein